MKTHFLGAACACAIALAVSISANASSVSGQGTWETTLQGRDLDSNLATAEAYYDTVLNITWLADASYQMTSGYDVDGFMDWTTANAWAAGLNPYSSGITGWRLPTVTDTGTSGCNFAYAGTDCGYNVNTATGDMAHMFYTTLGNLAAFNTAGVSQVGGGLTNSGPFSWIQGGTPYWSATEYAPNTSRAWDFYFDGPTAGLQGDQDFNFKSYGKGAWAVHGGDVGVPVSASAVPVPGAVWLFGSGLLGLIGMARRKAA